MKLMKILFFLLHLVIELCDGGELFDRIVQKGHYSERQVAKLIRISVEVIAASHFLSVMQRDFKHEIIFCLILLMKMLFSKLLILECLFFIS